MKHKAFTLLEILLVIAAIGILAAIVIVAINPQRQLSQVRNAETVSNINTLAKAIAQYGIENGEFPSEITSRFQSVCAPGGSSGCVDLSSRLVPEYIAAIPVDANATGAASGYEVALNIETSTVSIYSPYIDDQVTFQPAVIQDESLALWLDAGQLESYPGTGLTWFDLSGNDNHAILEGNASAVSFDSDGYFEHRPNPETWTNGGFWHIPHSPSLNPNDGFWTVCGSFTHPLLQSHNGGGWFGKRQLGINIETINWGGHRVRTNIGAYTTTWDTVLPFSDDFVYFCASFEQSTGMYGSNPGSLRTYLNGNLVSAVSATPQVDIGDPIRLARRIGHLQHYMYADIANYQYYTRTLSDDEIGQLYSAHRSLFDPR